MTKTVPHGTALCPCDGHNHLVVQDKDLFAAKGGITEVSALLGLYWNRGVVSAEVAGAGHQYLRSLEDPTGMMEIASQSERYRLARYYDLLAQEHTQPPCMEVFTHAQEDAPKALIAVITASDGSIWTVEDAVYAEILLQRLVRSHRIDFRSAFELEQFRREQFTDLDLPQLPTRYISWKRVQQYYEVPWSNRIGSLPLLGGGLAIGLSRHSVLDQFIRACSGGYGEWARSAEYMSAVVADTALPATPGNDLEEIRFSTGPRLTGIVLRSNGRIGGRIVVEEVDCRKLKG